MTQAGAVRVPEGGVLLMIGTMKGVFLLASDAKRAKWTMTGPHCAGQSAYSLFFDGRKGRTRILAGLKDWHFGAIIATSDDFGGSWNVPQESAVKFPKKTKASLANIWQITAGSPGDDDRLYAGVEPASLWESSDAGASWSLVKGLYDHPHRKQWMPGGGGLALHTILVHPKDRQKMIVAVSAGGVYRTADGGATWAAANKGIRAEFMPDKFPEFGQCVHKIAAHPKKPERLFLQNHWGLYRSDDAGGSWKDVANGVPSDFGFGMAAHPHDPNTVYIVPLESDGFRCVPTAKLRVYRTQNAGKSWEPLTKGLPQKNAYETVLRDGLCTDVLNPAGVYLGTRSGKVFASASEGASWKCIAETLPPVVCVKAVVPGPAPSRKKA